MQTFALNRYLLYLCVFLYIYSQINKPKSVFMKITMRIIALCAFALAGLALNAQSIEGVWKTVDDNSGKTKSEVEIELKNGKVFGTIIKLYKEPGEDPDPLCTACEGKLKNKKIIGMQIVNGLEKDDDEWYKDDGIIDPENGKWYDCKMWVDEDNNNELKVRGYIGFLYRTQTWYRVK